MQIFDTLQSFVVGQEHAKKALSVAVYNHYKRVAANLSEKCVQQDRFSVASQCTGGTPTLCLRSQTF